MGQVVASKKGRVSAAGVEPLGFNRDCKIGGAPNPDAERGYPIRKMTAPDSILPPMTQFDALSAQKYAHAYEQRAIAD